MKFTITGSLGNISLPLSQALIQMKHAVTIISSNADKEKEIKVLGATPAIGSLEDVDFLIKSFSGTDAVYCMIPPNNYFDHSLDLIEYYKRLARNYAQAIKQSGVKRVINLSTIGANLSEGNGILLGAHHAQNILNELPSNISIIHMRPTSFYYNLLGYLEMIKMHGAIMANYGTSIVPWVSPKDIAAKIGEEIVKPFNGRQTMYIASEELTGQAVASILGAAIGMPDLKWKIVSDEQARLGLVNIGMNPRIATGLVEMYASLESGVLSEDYFNNRPQTLGTTKMKDFANDFAHAFNQK